MSSKSALSWWICIEVSFYIYSCISKVVHVLLTRVFFDKSFCDNNQGCFSVIECLSEYEAAAYDVSSNADIDSNSTPVTGSPTMHPTQSPTQLSTPTIQPSSHSTIHSSSAAPTSKPTNDSVTSSTNEPTVSVTHEASVSMTPTLHPISSAPTRQNTNFCGVSWSSHAEDCGNARPCPKGDECSPEETCFSNSPCATVDNDLSVDTNVKHLCGTDWNTLVNECEDAIPCPRGDEQCPTGEICYRNFECNPPKSLASNEELSGAFETSSSNGTSQVVVNGQQLGAGNSTSTDATVETPLASDSESENDTSQSSTPTSTTSDEDMNSVESSSQGTLATGVENNSTLISEEQTNANAQTSMSQSTSTSDENEQTSTNVAEKEEAPTTLEYCNICGSAGEFDYTSSVNYDGFNEVNEIPCGELIWIFVNNNVHEGTSECLESRAKYFDDCCYTVPQNACQICSGKLADVRLDKQTIFLGSQTDCTRVSAHFSTKYEATSEQCAEAKTDHAYDCCFEKCTICGEKTPNWEASVMFSGEDLKCSEFDIMFREEDVTADSSRCQMSRDLYSDDCCIQPMESPCDLCQTQQSGKHLKNNETVSYEGSVTTCVEVYMQLFSRVEDGTQQCSRAQTDLFDQCCAHIDTNPAQTTYDRVPAPAKDNSPTPMPMPTEDSLSASWYAGSLEGRSSASRMSPLLGAALFFSYMPLVVY